jgi:hypothetical protein
MCLTETLLVYLPINDLETGPEVKPAIFGSWFNLFIELLRLEILD